MELPRNIPWRIVLPALGGALFMLIILLLIVSVSGGGRDTEETVPRPPLDLSLSDFIVEDPVPLGDPGWLPVRPIREKWEPEEIQEFWVDPVELGIQQLEKENDTLVRDFFETIP